jgi:periplasmic mercuric ion binding protein
VRHTIRNNFALAMKKSIILFAAVLLLGACSSHTEEAAVTAASAPSRTVAEAVINEGTPITSADLSISGMTCSMGCGSAIKSALAKLPGISKTEIVFNEGDASNHAIVTYDPARVSDADMVKAVEGLHDGQYKVLAVGITKQVLKTGDTDATKAEGDEVNASLPEVVMPSIFGLLSRLLRI